MIFAAIRKAVRIYPVDSSCESGHGTRMKALALCLFTILLGFPGAALQAQTAAPEAAELPSARWDHRSESQVWTRQVVKALGTHGKVLVDLVPRDIEDWCPAYVDADEAGRQAFWVGLLSALAKHESTYKPRAVGGGGKWYGLLQILPATARGYKCQARSREALKDGAANLSCAIRIMAFTVPRDGVVSKGMRGVAADWGPFHSQRKRTDMMEWVRAQQYCQPKPEEPEWTSSITLPVLRVIER